MISRGQGAEDAENSELCELDSDLIEITLIENFSLSSLKCRSKNSARSRYSPFGTLIFRVLRRGCIPYEQCKGVYGDPEMLLVIFS